MRDGWTSHGLDRSQFERDRREDIELSVAGWIIVRVTYRAVKRDGRRTAVRIQAAADRWATVQPPDTPTPLRVG